MASKYVAIYNGHAYPFDDEREFAKKMMGFNVVDHPSGGWDVIINKKVVAKYSGEYYTEEEVENDYFRSGNFFKKNTYKNLHFYQLIK